MQLKCFDVRSNSEYTLKRKIKILYSYLNYYRKSEDSTTRLSSRNIYYICKLPRLVDKTLYIIELNTINPIYDAVLIKNTYFINYKKYVYYDHNFDYEMISFLFSDWTGKIILFCTNEDIVLDFQLRNIDFSNFTIYTWNDLNNFYKEKRDSLLCKIKKIF